MTHDNNDINITELMQLRQFEPCRLDLAASIIHAAQQLPQKQYFSLLAWLRKTFAECMLPRPAYILPPLLLVGFILGFSDLSSTQIETDDNSFTVSFVSEDGNL